MNLPDIFGGLLTGGDAIAPILDTVSPVECANYFANAGYDQT